MAQTGRGTGSRNTRTNTRHTGTGARGNAAGSNIVSVSAYRANAAKGNAAKNNAHTATRPRSMYVYDSTARDLEVRRQIEEEPRKKLSHVARKNRDKALHMNLGYVFFLMGALCVCAVVLINYIQLQSEITDKVKTISKLESELNTLQLTNEEDYNKIISSVDLEEIKKIAIGELGMTYAKEGQIITYSNTGYDYMRQVNE